MYKKFANAFCCTLHLKKFTCVTTFLSRNMLPSPLWLLRATFTWPTMGCFNWQNRVLFHLLDPITDVFHLADNTQKWNGVAISSSRHCTVSLKVGQYCIAGPNGWHLSSLILTSQLHPSINPTRKIHTAQKILCSFLLDPLHASSSRFLMCTSWRV